MKEDGNDIMMSMCAWMLWSVIKFLCGFHYIFLRVHPRHFLQAGKNSFFFYFKLTKSSVTILNLTQALERDTPLEVI